MRRADSAEHTGSPTDPAAVDWSQSDQGDFALCFVYQGIAYPVYDLSRRLMNIDRAIESVCPWLADYSQANNGDEILPGHLATIDQQLWIPVSLRVLAITDEAIEFSLLNIAPEDQRTINYLVDVISASARTMAAEHAAETAFVASSALPTADLVAEQNNDSHAHRPAALPQTNSANLWGGLGRNKRRIAGASVLAAALLGALTFLPRNPPSTATAQNEPTPQDAAKNQANDQDQSTENLLAAKVPPASPISDVQSPSSNATRLTGIVRANMVPLIAPVAGELDQLLVQDGEQVVQGQLLAWIDTAPSVPEAAPAELARAKAAVSERRQAYTLALRQLDRIRPLIDNDNIGRNEATAVVDEVQSKLDQLRIAQQALQELEQPSTSPSATTSAQPPQLVAVRAQQSGVFHSASRQLGGALAISDSIGMLQVAPRPTVEYVVPAAIAENLRVGSKVALQIPSKGLDSSLPAKTVDAVITTIGMIANDFTEANETQNLMRVTVALDDNTHANLDSIDWIVEVGR